MVRSRAAGPGLRVCLPVLPGDLVVVLIVNDEERSLHVRRQQPAAKIDHGHTEPALDRAAHTIAQMRGETEPVAEDLRKVIEVLARRQVNEPPDREGLAQSDGGPGRAEGMRDDPRDTSEVLDQSRDGLGELQQIGLGPLRRPVGGQIDGDRLKALRRDREGETSKLRTPALPAVHEKNRRARCAPPMTRQLEPSRGKDLGPRLLQPPAFPLGNPRTARGQEDPRRHVGAKLRRKPIDASNHRPHHGHRLRASSVRIVPGPMGRPLLHLDLVDLFSVRCSLWH